MLTVLNFSVNDTLDDIMNESGDEEEQDAIVSQVLDEIGIEISGKVMGLLLLQKNILSIETTRFYLYQPLG